MSLIIIVDTSLIKNPEDECIYLCGNSLGLQPKSARDYVNRQFEKWEKMYVKLSLNEKSHVKFSNCKTLYYFNL